MICGLDSWCTFLSTAVDLRMFTLILIKHWWIWFHLRFKHRATNFCERSVNICGASNKNLLISWPWQSATLPQWVAESSINYRMERIGTAVMPRFKFLHSNWLQVEYNTEIHQWRQPSSRPVVSWIQTGELPIWPYVSSKSCVDWTVGKSESKKIFMITVELLAVRDLFISEWT